MKKIFSLVSSNIFKFSSVLIFSQALNFLLIFIYLKIIDSAVYGTIGLFQSYAILIGVISMLGMRDGFYTLYYKVNKITLYSNFFLFFISSLSVVSMFAFLFSNFIIEWLNIPLELYTLVFIYAFSNAIYSNFEITMRLENWNSLYIYIVLIRSFLVFFTKLYFVLHITTNEEFIKNILLTDIVSYICISLIIFIIINIKVLNFRYKIDFSLYPRLFKVGLPSLASNGSGWIFNGLDRVLIERFFSLEILGLYMYGTKIALAMGNIIHQVLNLLYAPKALKLLSENKILEMEFLGKRISNWLIVLLLGTVGFSLLVSYSLEYFSISSPAVISLFFLGALTIEIAKIVPRINGQKVVFLEKNYILSLLHIGSSLIIISLYYLFLPILGIGIIFLAQLVVYFLITYMTHYYIVHKTDFQIVKINFLFWMISLFLIIYLLSYFFNIKGVL